jgi:hypothetical protein
MRIWPTFKVRCGRNSLILYPLYKLRGDSWEQPGGIPRHGKSSGRCTGTKLHFNRLALDSQRRETGGVEQSRRDEQRATRGSIPDPAMLSARREHPRNIGPLVVGNPSCEPTAQPYNFRLAMRRVDGPHLTVCWTSNKWNGIVLRLGFNPGQEHCDSETE